MVPRPQKKELVVAMQKQSWMILAHLYCHSCFRLSSAIAGVYTVDTARVRRELAELGEPIDHAGH